MPLWLGWLLAGAVIALFCSLGSWQLGRAKQKEAMLADAQRILAERRAVPLSERALPARARDYSWTQGHGRYLDAPAVLLDNQNHQGRTGVRVLRLFQPDDGAAPMLVDLGWLPLPGNRQLPTLSLATGEAELRGLLAPPPSEGMARAYASRQPNGEILTTALDAPELPQLLGVTTLSPRLLKLDPALPGGYTRDLDILPNTLPPERHLGYAVQWFGLALAVFITALVVSLRGRGRRGRDAASHEKMPR